jgi:hypothetical protein
MTEFKTDKDFAHGTSPAKAGSIIGKVKIKAIKEGAHFSLLELEAVMILLNTVSEQFMWHNRGYTHTIPQETLEKLRDVRNMLNDKMECAKDGGAYADSAKCMPASSRT